MSEFIISPSELARLKAMTRGNTHWTYTGKLDLVWINLIDSREYTVTVVWWKDYQYDYKRELHAISALRDSNPYIVKYFGAWREKGLLFIQTENQSDSLATKHSKTKITNTELMKVITDIIGGIEYLHSKAIYNLDINLESIFLSETGYFKLNWFKYCVKLPASSSSIDEFQNTLDQKLHDIQMLGKTLLELMLQRTIDMQSESLTELYNFHSESITENYACSNLLKLLMNPDETIINKSYTKILQPAASKESVLFAAWQKLTKAFAQSILNL